MCSLARPSAHGCFDATAFLDRRRGVAAVAPAARGVMARETVASSARPQKRARDSLDRKAGFREGSAAVEAPVVPAPRGQRRLQERMKAELEAVGDLHKKAFLLCRRGKAGTARFSAAVGPRREAPSEAEAKRRKTSPTKPAAEAAHRIRPVKPPPQPLSQHRMPERKIKKAKEVEERRRRKDEEEELAREREDCRRLVLAMEMAALPDETVYPRDLEELGIAPFEYAVTRTRSQALSQDRILVGVAYYSS